MTFTEIANTFRDISDNDLDSHYLLMIESSSLQYTLEADLAEENRIYSELKIVAEVIEARRSKELSTKSVNEGARLAKCDEEVHEAKTKVAKQKYIVEALQAQVHFLERIYFTCKECLSRGQKINGRI